MELDSPIDNFNLEINNVRQLWEKDNTPKIKSKLNGTQVKINYEPIKIKVRYKNLNLNKIKHKFKRGTGSNRLMGLNDTCPRLKEDLVGIRGTTSNVNKSTMASYSTNQPNKSSKRVKLLRLNSEDIYHSNESAEVNSIFVNSTSFECPRQTAYFGK